MIFFVENVIILMYNKNMKILSKLFLIFAVSSLCINRVSGETVSLQSLVTAAKENNPEIIAAKQELSAAKSGIIPSRTWADPKFEIMWEEIPTDKTSLGSSRMRVYSVSQMIPFPGKLSLKGSIQKETAKIYEQMYEAKELEVISKLKKSYNDYFFIHKSIEIYRENSELITHFSKVAEQRYAVGKAQQMDILRSHVELAKIENMIITLNQDKETIQADINTLLNRPPDDALGIPEKPVFSPLKLTLKELEKIALDNRPELAALTDKITRSEKSLTLSKMGYLPDFMAAYKQRRMDGNFESWDANLGFTLPLYFWKQSGTVKEKKFGKDASASQYESLKNTTLYMVKAIYVKIDTAYRLAELYRTNFLPQAEQALKIAEISYKGGKISFLDLLDSERSLLNFQLEYYRYLTDYEKYTAELEKVLGLKLDDYKN